MLCSDWDTMTNPLVLGDDQAHRAKQTKIYHSYPRTGGIWFVVPSPLSLDPAYYVQTDIDLKKAAKQFATKFATGSSVTKNAQGLDEIVVQGDVSDEVLEMIEGGVGVLKGVPEKNISVVEDKKKKAGE